MPIRMFAFNQDGQWPRLSPNGLMSGFGSGTDNVHARTADGTIHDLGVGRLGRPLDDRYVTFFRNVDDQRTQRLVWDSLHPTVEARLTSEPWELVAGNDLDAADGIWCSWLDRELGTGRRGRLVVNGLIIGYDYGGVRTTGGWVAARNNAKNIVEVWRFGSPERYSVPVHPEFNRFSVSSQGWVGFGYWGTPWIIAPNGAVVAIPHGWGWLESWPVLVHRGDEVWAWTHTIDPTTNRSYIYGRHLEFVNGQVKFKQLGYALSFGASWLDARFVDGTFYVVGADEHGNAQGWSVVDTEARQGLPEGQIITPPEDDVPNPPGVAIISYDKILNSTGDWKLVYQDRNNQKFNTRTVVELKAGDLTVEIQNDAGSDKTGTRRHVEISK